MATATMLPQITDLDAEADEFDRLLTGLEPRDWPRATQFKQWTVDDIVQHLHMGDRMALASATDETAFVTLMVDVQAKRATGLSRVEETRQRMGGLKGPALRERWRATLRQLCDVLAAKPAETRLKWSGPDMGLRMFTTARQMEVWAHAQAIYDLEGSERPAPLPRLRNIAEIGVRTFGWTFRVHGLPIPPAVPHVRLDGPDGAAWDWNEGNAADRVSGDAVAFCQGDPDPQCRRHHARRGGRERETMDEHRAMLRRPAGDAAGKGNAVSGDVAGSAAGSAPFQWPFGVATTHHHLTLRRPRGGHLEGWPRRVCSFPSFETQPAAALSG